MGMLLIPAALALFALAFWLGWKMREDYNMDLYIDEQNKRVVAEEELDAKAKEYSRLWRMLQVNDADAIRRERTIARLLDEVARLQGLALFSRTNKEVAGA